MGFPLWWRCGGGGRGGREALCDVESVRLIACIARVGTGVLFFFFTPVPTGFMSGFVVGWLVGWLVGTCLQEGSVGLRASLLACVPFDCLVLSRLVVRQ